MCSFFWGGRGGCLCSRFVPLRLYRMNNSPAGWWKEGRESAKRWGGVTLVPAGCRSPGRCCGNHSHQPDGISVGEHEKDGSGSVLPGPARPKKQLRANTVPGERERERESGLQEDFAELGDKKRVFRWKYSRGCVSCITHTLAFNHTHTCKKKRGFARISSKQTEKTFYLILTLENLGSMPWLPVTFIPSVVFLAMAQCCAHTAK